MPCSSHSVSCIENGEIVPAGLVKHISTWGGESLMLEVMRLGAMTSWSAFAKLSTPGSIVR